MKSFGLSWNISLGFRDNRGASSHTPPNGTRAGPWLRRLTRGFDGGLQPGGHRLKRGVYHWDSQRASSYATVMWTWEDFPRVQTVARYLAMYSAIRILACIHIYTAQNADEIDPDVRLGSISHT